MPLRRIPLKKFAAIFLQVMLIGVCAQVSVSQAVPGSGGTASTSNGTTSGGETTPSLERKFAINFIQDQKAIWTSPLRLKRGDAFWLVPAVAIGAEMFHRDAYLQQKLTPRINPGTTSKTFSDYGVVAMAGGIAGMYFLGRIHSDEHARETGVLAAEAAVNSLAFSSVLKYSLRRERPFNGTGRGDFFVGGGDSFPSSHAITAFSMATVFAHEYPGVLTQIGAYGLASAISVARVTGRQHFPTDVVVGGALGYGIGRMVYRHHHDPEQPGADIGTFIRDKETEPLNLGSVSVPMESWVYAAFDKLASLGFLQSGFSAVRPWTELECARLLREADTLIADNPERDSSDAAKIVAALEGEFSQELSQLDGGSRNPLSLDSVYTRFIGVTGPPLDDAYHFGQTTYNDYGRSVREGLNAVSGFSGSATHGHWSAYVRGEYQHSPGAPALAASALNTISVVDETPLQPSLPFQPVNRLRFLDAYVGLTLNGWQFSFGKQSLWWGPSDSSALMFSNNAEPVTMFRLSRVRPAVLPSLLQWLGPMRTEFLLGQLSGQQFVRIRSDGTNSRLFGPGLARQPFIQAARLAFKPTPNFEFGLSVSTIFGGPGFPITTKTFLRTFSLGNTNPGLAGDPGDRRSGFDFKYRLPVLRNWLTLYNDSFTEDEISPIAYPRRSAMNSGLYLSHVPGAQRLDFRVEGIYTDIPNLRAVGNFYANTRYLSGYTNQRHILGSWIGRSGTGVRLITSFAFTPQNKISVGYRDMRVSPLFIPNGGRLQDFFVQSNWVVRENIEVSAGVQYERWNFPVLAPTRQSNVASTLQLTYRPNRPGTH